MKITNVDVNMKDSSKVVSKMKWYKASEENFSIHGLLWRDLNKNFHRLVDSDDLRENLRFLSSHPSGVYITFTTNSTSISLKASVSSGAYMSHMTAIGQCGFDLYVKHKNKYIFLATTKINAAEYEINILKEVSKKERDYLIYFPLYTGFNSLEVGLDEKASINHFDDYKKEKIVCYGTSITQGGCATRPGMNFSSIMGRNLDYEVYNLGFSGNAHLDESISLRLRDVQNMKYLILEVEANTSGNGLMIERLSSWIETVSQNKYLEKIYLITHYPLSTSLLKKKEKQSLDFHFDFQKKICENNPLIELIDGKKIFKETSFDEAVDGVHLTDLGFYVLSKVMVSKIKKNNK